MIGMPIENLFLKFNLFTALCSLLPRYCHSTRFNCPREMKTFESVRCEFVCRKIQVIRMIDFIKRITRIRIKHQPTNEIFFSASFPEDNLRQIDINKYEPTMVKGTILY